MGKRLVAYFSASGVTKGLAEKLAEAIEADIFEIAPVEPYTEADLKWTNPLARCNREKAGKKRCGNKRNGTGYGQLRDLCISVFQSGTGLHQISSIRL